MRIILNVSLIVRDKVTRQCPQTTTFEEKGEPKRISNRVPSAYQPNALPLGQTGWQIIITAVIFTARCLTDKEWAHYALHAQQDEKCKPKTSKIKPTKLESLCSGMVTLWHLSLLQVVFGTKSFIQLFSWSVCGMVVTSNAYGSR